MSDARDLSGRALDVGEGRERRLEARGSGDVLILDRDADAQRGYVAARGVTGERRQFRLRPVGEDVVALHDTSSGNAICVVLTAAPLTNTSM